MKNLTKKETLKLDPKPSKKDYFRFNLFFFIMTTLPMVLVALFNIIVDPYDVYKTENLFGINHEKPKKENNDRLFKAIDVINIQPVTVILGSSRTKQGIDPFHPVFKDQQPAYNLAINGPNVYEVRRYLEHAIKNQKEIKSVVLGIDFFMFNETLKNQPTFSETRLEKESIALQDLLNTTLSLDALAASQETIKASLNKPKPTTDDYGKGGFSPNRNANDGRTKGRFNSAIKLYFELHSNYKFSEQYFEDFRRIVQLSQEEKFDLKIFISPAHATDLEAIRATGSWEAFEDWKRKLVAVTPVWDFSGYNSVTTEPIKEIMINYVDNSHYTPLVGNLVINRIFDYQLDTIPQDFGVLLTPDNVEEYLAKVRSDRQIWIQKHPGEVDLVREIKQKMSP
jgi:hypothetical protein